MAYLGRGLDKISNIEVLDNITFDGSSSYSITKGSVAFTVNSAQSCLLSIDGVVQATNFTVNGSTIDFGVAIPSTSTCNFFLHYGTGVMTVPSDGSVTTAKLGDGSVTSAKLDSGVALGKILQVVHTKLETGVSANNSLVASGLIASITPSSTSSKILIMTTVGGIRNTSGVWFQFYVYRQINGGGYSNFDQLEGGLLYNSSTITTNMARNIMDTTHNTTNQIDYQIYFQPTNGVGNINVDGLESSTITLMEVSG